MSEATERMREFLTRSPSVVFPDEVLELFEPIERENAKLVDVLHEVEEDAIYAYRCLQQDCITITDSSTHFFEKWWHSECELDRAKAENSKLCELVRELYEDQCDECDQWRYRDRMCELGVEVDE